MLNCRLFKRTIHYHYYFYKLEGYILERVIQKKQEGVVSIPQITKIVCGSHRTGYIVYRYT
jgi:hypothetical protein